MGRRYGTKGLAKDRVYDFQQASRIVGVSMSTFRKFPMKGLRVISDKRPKLVRGEDLMIFLQKQAEASRQPCRPEQFYCMRCKGPRDALGGMADYVPTNDMTGRLQAFCASCEGPCSKFASPKTLHHLSENLEIQISEASHA
ncbi:MAG: hypothetical protein AAF386_03595 [Pseudomonadota bacterium]